MKYLAPLALALLAAPLAQAQNPTGFRLGLKAGLTYANAAGNDIRTVAGTGYSARRERGPLGYSAGLTFSIPVGSGGWFALMPEVLYTQRGYRINANSQSTLTLPTGVTSQRFETRRTLTYLDLPILARLRAGNMHFEIGPQLSYLLGSEANSQLTTTGTAGAESETSDFPDYTSTRRPGSYTDDLNELDWGLAGGLSYQSRTGFSLTARYARGLRNLLDPSGDNQPRVVNSTLSLQVGYSLPVGRQ